jgi:hypothetical protein
MLPSQEIIAHPTIAAKDVTTKQLGRCFLQQGQKNNKHL